MRTDEEFTVLLEGINATEAALAANLLEAEDIPSMRHGSDHDAGRFGSEAQAAVWGTNLLVPHAALDRARGILAEAGFGESPRREVSPEARAGVRRLQVRGLLLVVATLLAAGLGVGDGTVLLFGMAGLAVIFLLEARQRFA